MKATLLIGAALSLLVIPAFGADLGTDALFKAPPVPPPFTWTGCYGGAHVGGGWASKAITDPVQLVQDSFAGMPVTTGVTTASVSPVGFIGGGQIGCDYQLAPTWVVGVEGAASGSTLKGSTIVGLPLGLPGETASVSGAMDLLPSVTARLGYAADRWLFYVKGGAALASDSYSVTGTFTGTPFDFEGLDLRYGWTVGGGVEWAFTDIWSARLEYDFYQFGNGSVQMSDSTNVLSGPVNVRQSVQVVKAGLNFHVWWGQ
ncbi:MAG: outer membrane beta-barrel protein [Terriglobales bacterium]